ncbi:unnamed protein product [Phytophthora fragariaefolia]|uniref:Unnamed protein product n=1 Tax=Phytophthora fragariaefolia TaxID=1490495 RepID=A0A9W6Y0D1_9STRA|nr:unnamed protein product [Phytophthora fragariaefolia]
MSAYLHGFEEGCYAHAPAWHSDAVGPLAARDLEDDEFSADFGFEERDIDAEIEARQQRSQSTPAPLPAPPPPAPRTVSQQMLRSLQRHRKNSRTAPPPQRRRTPRDSTYDLRSVVNDDASVAPTERLTDTFDTPLSSRSGWTCTDRLEARISKSFLEKAGGSGSGRTAAEEGHNASAMYSGRRTYPAESVRNGRGRMSDSPTKVPATPQEAKMLEMLETERASRVYRPHMSSPEVSLRARRNSGVSFRFNRGTLVEADSLNGRMGRMVLADGRSASGSALVRAQRAKRVTDPEYTTLASQLAEIEALVEGINSCMKKHSFSTLAARALKEMELLGKATQQIRTNGTTLILACVGKQQNAEFTQALRRLVARSATVQKRIVELMRVIKKRFMV